MAVVQEDKEEAQESIHFNQTTLNMLLTTSITKEKFNY